MTGNISLSGADGNAPSELVRLLDLQTGEIHVGDADSLLDDLFGAGAARQRTDERFSEAGGTQAASHAPGLYREPYLATSGRKVHLKVHADLVEAHSSGGMRDEADFETVGQAHRKDQQAPVRGVVVGFKRRPRSRMIRALAKNP